MPTPKGTKPWNYGMSNGWVDKRGYKWRYVTENGKRRARREHRVIMEQHLKRRLEPWELVHHKDGNPNNNSIENLEVMEWGKHTTVHHTGARASEDSRRTMQAFALLREELNHVRSVNADLLAALEAIMPDLKHYAATHGPGPDERLTAARAALAKARG